MRKQICRLAGIAAVLAASTLASEAHVNFEKRQVKADTTYKAVLTITHGCEGAPTHTFRVRLPEGVFNIKPMPKPGWTIKLVEGKYSKPQIYHGKTYESGVTEIVWSGGSVADGYFDEFIFRVRIGAFDKQTPLYFPATQECTKGQHAWVEIPAPDQSRRDLEHPAPVLEVAPGHGSGHAH